MAVIGTLVAESLRPGAVVELGLTLRRLQRVAVTDVAAGQPSVWTLVDFTCADTDAEAFARQLAAGLNPGPWYTDFATGETKYVVFAGRVFAYRRGDRVSYTEAAAYARSVGVPETQLDWPS